MAEKSEKKSLSDEELVERLERSLIDKDREFSTIAEKSFILRSNAKRNTELSELEDRRNIKKLVEQKKTLQREKIRAQNSKFYEKEFWNYYISRNQELFTNLIMDLNCLLVAYPFNTLKTRIQSKHLYEDVSFFIKNKVENQHIYRGLSQGFISSLIGNVVNVSVFRYANIALEEKLRDFSPFQRNMTCFMAADIVTTIVRQPFEVRKQLLQMNDKEITLKKQLNAMRRSLVPCLFRDLAFRSSFLLLHDFFLIKHYYYYKYIKGIDGDDVSMLRNSKAEYQRRITLNDRYTAMVFSTLLASLISNPFDLVGTKVTTQQYEKYTGPINCLRTVLKEEGAKKLLTSGYWARTCFYLTNGVLVFYFYDSLREMVEEAYSL